MLVLAVGIVLHLFIVAFLLLNEILQLVCHMPVFKSREAVAFHWAHESFKYQHLGQVEEQKSLVDGDILARQDLTVVEVGRELGAPISFLPLPVRFAEYAEYLALKGVLDDSRVTRLV